MVTRTPSSGLAGVAGLDPAEKNVAELGTGCVAGRLLGFMPGGTRAGIQWGRLEPGPSAGTCGGGSSAPLPVAPAALAGCAAAGLFGVFPAVDAAGAGFVCAGTASWQGALLLARGPAAEETAEIRWLRPPELPASRCRGWEICARRSRPHRGGCRADTPTDGLLLVLCLAPEHRGLRAAASRYRARRLVARPAAHEPRVSRQRQPGCRSRTRLSRTPLEPPRGIDEHSKV